MINALIITVFKSEYIFIVMPLFIVALLSFIIDLFMNILYPFINIAVTNIKYDKSYDIYESGPNSIRKSDGLITTDFLIIAILFLIFDLEIIFLYPWSLQFHQAIFIFSEYQLAGIILMLILLLGFVIEWSGDLLDL